MRIKKVIEYIFKGYELKEVEYSLVVFGDLYFFCEDSFEDWGNRMVVGEGCIVLWGCENKRGFLRN